MKIVFDARCIRAGMTGVGYYAANLLEQLPDVLPNDEILVLWLSSEPIELRPPGASAASNVRWIEVDADPQSHPAGDWWLHQTLPKLLQEWQADVYHNPAFLIPFSRQSKKTKSTRFIASVHDFSVFTYPQSYPWRFRLYLQTMLRKILQHADSILFCSEFTQQEAQRLFPNFKKEKSHVIPLAHASQFEETIPEDISESDTTLNLPEQFFLMVGTLEHRKNPQFFLRLYDALDQQQIEIPLVWAGGLGHDYQNILRELEPLIKRGLFIHKSKLCNQDLPILYQKAQVLLYPSHEEGFGLPLLEAMASGLPVLAAESSCLPEVVGDGGRCLPLDNVNLWTDALQSLLNDRSKYKEAQLQARQHAQKFSWKQTAEKTAAVYHKKNNELKI